jgi:hypothetical protein
VRPFTGQDDISCCCAALLWSEFSMCAHVRLMQASRTAAVTPPMSAFCTSWHAQSCELTVSWKSSQQSHKALVGAGNLPYTYKVSRPSVSDHLCRQEIWCCLSDVGMGMGAWRCWHMYGWQRHADVLTRLALLTLLWEFMWCC